MELENKTLLELREIAREIGVKNYTKYKKAELVALIGEKTGEKQSTEQPEAPPQKTETEEPEKQPDTSEPSALGRPKDASVRKRPKTARSAETPVTAGTPPADPDVKDKPAAFVRNKLETPASEEPAALVSEEPAAPVSNENILSEPELAAPASVRP